MNKLKELLSKCKASVSITVNKHRDYYQSVEEHIEEQALIDEELIDEIGKEVYEEMKKTNTIVEIQAYPESNDIIGLKDIFLQLDMSNTKINIVRDTISSGQQISGIGYKVTSSYSNGTITRS